MQGPLFLGVEFMINCPGGGTPTLSGWLTTRQITCVPPMQPKRALG